MLSESQIESEAEFEALADRPEWQLACRVAASRTLGKSERLPKFLLYICERHLLGKSHEIHEQRIGTQVFLRPTDYNPGEDNIVRSYARLLRKRLDLYFAGEGSFEATRITIPRGGYIPIFEPLKRQKPNPSRLSHAPLPSASLVQSGIAASNFAILEDGLDEKVGPESPAERPPVVRFPEGKTSEDSRIVARHARRAWLSGLLGLAAGVLLASAGWLGLHAVETRRALTPAHPVWAQLFQPDRDTLIVPSDSGLGILQNLSRHLVTVQEYANGSYLSEMNFPTALDPRNRNDLGRERYTSVVSLNITAQLARLPEYIPDRTQVRYARSVTAEDFEHSNVILLGSKHSNPWVSLFEKKLAFRLEYTPEVDESYVVNEHPVGTEQKIYNNSTGSASSLTYGTIAYLPGPGGSSHILIVQGLNMAATQAAADLLFHAQGLQPVLKQAALPGGGLRPFEVLVETSSVGATAPTAQIIATRIDPP